MIKVEKTVADYVAFFLHQKRVEAVFQLSGGMIAFLADAISQEQTIRIINVRHEQAAGFAAEGYSRISGIPGVAMGTSGPGATNLLTAIASCYFDSTPALFITGQVNQNELRKSLHQRQNGFQELDIVSMVKGISKFALQAKTAEDVFNALSDAWKICQEGRSGPVLLDIPIDVQQIQIGSIQAIYNQYEIEKSNKKTIYQDKQIENVSQMLESSLFPLILAGGGIRLGGAIEAFRDFVSQSQIPVVHSLMAVDALPSNSQQRIGMIGSYGNRWANKALAKSDTLLVLGSRLDVRQTGSSVSSFHENKKIIRVDIDEFELSGRVNADLKIRMPLLDFFASVGKISLNSKAKEFTHKIHHWKLESPAINEQHISLELNPNFLMDWLSKNFVGISGYSVDVGQHQMWAAQSIEISPNQRFMTSGGLGAMGFATPAAIGATQVSNGKWVAIVGDGCLQLSISELQTCFQYQLPIAICVINNRQHGMVAQFQEENMDSRFIGTRDDYTTPDFVNLSKAFGIPAIRITSKNQLESLRNFINEWEKGPIVIEFELSNEAKALPKLSRNSSLGDL